MEDFRLLADWKAFERLCADLLQAEGFVVESEPFVDRTGIDIVAIEEYRSHSLDRSIKVKWRVQCKHYAESGKNLGRKEIEECLSNYDLTREANEGLFLITDTDYSEAAQEVLSKYLAQHPHARVTLWNQRLINTYLQRHQHLLVRYGLQPSTLDNRAPFGDLKKLGPIRTLLISDQSAMAHDLTAVLRRAGFDITYLAFWNYEALRWDRFLADAALQHHYDLMICFLGDTFEFPLPVDLVSLIVDSYDHGVPLLLFPFLAWTLKKGLHRDLEHIIPVRLLEVDDTRSKSILLERVARGHRRGDFRWLLEADSFAEDQYVELDPGQGMAPFANGITSPFGLSHSFEYLRVSDTATCAWKDTTGNPVVVFSDSGRQKICYLNTCCHSCMTLSAIASPFEFTSQASRLMANVLLWLLEK